MAAQGLLPPRGGLLTVLGSWMTWGLVERGVMCPSETGFPLSIEVVTMPRTPLLSSLPRLNLP